LITNKKENASAAGERYLMNEKFYVVAVLTLLFLRTN
jgi:hypothetical protein